MNWICPLPFGLNLFEGLIVGYGARNSLKGGAKPFQQLLAGMILSPGPFNAPPPPGQPEVPSQAEDGGPGVFLPRVRSEEAISNPSHGMEEVYTVTARLGGERGNPSLGVLPPPLDGWSPVPKVPLKEDIKKIPLADGPLLLTFDQAWEGSASPHSMSPGSEGWIQAEGARIIDLIQGKGSIPVTTPTMESGEGKGYPLHSGVKTGQGVMMLDLVGEGVTAPELPWVPVLLWHLEDKGPEFTRDRVKVLAFLVDIRDASGGKSERPGIKSQAHTTGTRPYPVKGKILVVQSGFHNPLPMGFKTVLSGGEKAVGSKARTGSGDVKGFEATPSQVISDDEVGQPLTFQPLMLKLDKAFGKKEPSTWGKGDEPEARVLFSPRATYPLKTTPLKLSVPMSQPRVNGRQVIDQIVHKARLLLKEGRAEIEVRLKPEHLGTMKVQVALEDRWMVVRLGVENQEVRHLIESHLDQLRASLTQRGLEVKEFDVFVEHRLLSPPGQSLWAGLDGERGRGGHLFAEAGTESQAPEDGPGAEMAFRSFGYNTVEWIA